MPIFSRLLAVALAAGATGSLATAAAQDRTWPRDIVVEGRGVITIYQPQFEALKGNVLTGRGAMSFTLTGKEPVFGAFWFQSTLEADNDSRMATLRNVKITRVKWPNATEASQAEWTRIVEGAAPEAMTISMDRLRASMTLAERETRNREGLKNDPPKIIVTNELSVLLLYDGEPRTIKIPNTPFEQVPNTAMAVAKAGNVYYLAGGKVWYSASDPKGPWTPGAKPPADLVKIVPKDTSKTPAPNPPPKIVVATEPTELIVTDGAPKWKPIGNGDLLYVENTETPILRQVEPAGVFILLSGRWFRATGLEGPWSFVRPDSLPAAFATQISSTSPLGGVRASIPGTEEAEEAMVDAAIPQTAAIKRSAAKLEITWNGDPQFKDIEGTKLAYALNSSAQMIRVGGKFYAVENGVWFVAASPNGPWTVADSIPKEEIDKIPPSAPVYNLTDVEIFGSTSEVVYVGYYPGYMYSYPYYGVPFYGTGWYYPPYWGPMGPHPTPYTWGFHVGYNPWTGWNFGLSWSNGWMTIGIGFGGGYGGYYRPWYPPYGGGWYGPGGYRPGGCYNCDINIGGGNNNINIGNRVGGGDRVSQLPANQRPGAGLGRDNLYNRPETKDMVADRGTSNRATRELSADRAATGKANNVFADKDGNISRRTSQGWENRDGGQWKADQSGGADRAGGTGAGGTPAARPSTGAGAGARPSAPITGGGMGGSYAPVNGMERDWNSRVQGSTNASRPAPRSTTSMSRGAARGGGGRRR